MILGIHFLRGIAALLVVLYHIYYVAKIYIEFNSPVFTNLYVGVDIFFVISGFIMFYILNRADLKCGSYPIEFIKNRLVRVVPLYWIFTICMYYSNNFIYLSGSDKHFSLTHLIHSLFFIPFVDGYGEVSPPVLGVGWTLNYEMFFYALIYVCLLTCKNRVFIAYNYILVLLPLLGLCFQNWTGYFSVIFSPFLVEFLLGSFVGWLYMNRANLLIPGALASSGMLFITYYCIVSAGIVISEEYIRVLIAGGCSVSIVAFSLKLDTFNIVKKYWSTKGMRIFGSSSYILYLIHHPLISMIGKAWNHYNLFDSMVMFFTLCLFVVYFTSIVVEWLYCSYVEEHVQSYFMKSKVLG